MRKLFYEGRFVFIPLGIAAFLTLTGFVVMGLWNALLPNILHVATITFWQALGIFVLCKILFGFGKGGGGFKGRGMWRERMERRMQNMSPEERERFKAEMKNRMCGPRGHRWGGFVNEEDLKAKENPTV